MEENNKGKPVFPPLVLPEDLKPLYSNLSRITHTPSAIVRITSYNVCYTKLLRKFIFGVNRQSIFITLFCGIEITLLAQGHPSYNFV